MTAPLKRSYVTRGPDLELVIRFLVGPGEADIAPLRLPLPGFEPFRAFIRCKTCKTVPRVDALEARPTCPVCEARERELAEVEREQLAIEAEKLADARELDRKALADMAETDRTLVRTKPPIGE